MATNQYQEAWFASAPGRAVDPDHVAGLQCVDVPKDYAEHIWANTTWKQAWPGAGNAEDMDSSYSGEYFDFIPNNPADPNLIPQRGDIIIWDGTPDWGVNPYGHIAVVLAADPSGVTVIQQDGFLQVPMWVGTLGYDNPGTGPVSGWLRPKFDDAPASAPAPVTGTSTIRITGPMGVIERQGPTTGSQALRTFGGDKALTFQGFVRASSETNGTNIWFVGISGNYFSASAFTSQSTDGLADLTDALLPPVQQLADYQRITGADGAIRRSAPNKNASVIDTYMPERILDFKGWVHGEDPYGGGNDIWFVGRYSGGYVWSGVLADPGTGALPELTASEAPAPEPVAAYDFELAFATVNGIAVEKHPAHIGNVDTGNFPALPEKYVDHWWNSPDREPQFAGVVNTFQTEGKFLSAHFVVGLDRIAQMVALTDRAYHAASVGNAYVGIEIDPRAVEDSEVGRRIRANVRALHLLLDAHYGIRRALTLHKNVPLCSTSCSDLPLAALEVDYTGDSPVLGPDPAPAPAKPTDTEPATVAETEAGVLRKFFEWLIALFINRDRT